MWKCEGTDPSLGARAPTCERAVNARLSNDDSNEQHGALCGEVIGPCLDKTINIHALLAN